MPPQSPRVSRRWVLAGSAALSAPAIFGETTRAAHAAAPRLGPSVPTYHRFKLGDFEITTLSDAAMMIDGPWPIVGEDRPKAEVERLMRESLLPPSRFQPGFTPTLVNTGDQIIIFDAGNGDRGFIPRPQGGQLAHLLSVAGYQFDQVDVVVLSHCHIDHIGGLLENGKPLFPKARYVVGEVEYRFWSSSDRLSARDSLERRSGALFHDNVLPFSARTSFIKNESQIAPGIHAIEAFGHTPGHMAFHLESRGQRLLLWGDCAHHEVASLAHPAWHALFDMDKATGAATRKRIYDMAATERVGVIAYHASFPSIGFIEKTGTAYRWIPVSYQFNI